MAFKEPEKCLYNTLQTVLAIISYFKVKTNGVTKQTIPKLHDVCIEEALNLYS